MSRGIFRLKQVYEEQLSGEWSTREEVWNVSSPFSKAHPFGYAGGGQLNSGASVTTVDRIDYGNDTATAATKGPLTIARTSSGSTGNASFGYYGAGTITPGYTNVSSVERISYGNDTATTAIKSALQVPVYGARGAGNDSYGYIGGGAVPHKSSVDRIDYANDASAPS